MSWADHAILWHVYPLGFTGAERAALPADEPARHRLRHLEAWLDYAIELGCNGLLLGPVFAAETHGYDTVDHFRIDARLGDEDDFDALVAAADQRGLRLILDGVFNHVARGFPAFKAAVAGGPSAPAARWFKRTPDGTDYAVFEGHGRLVEFDHDEPAVVSYVIEVMTYWLGRGAGGWRLDAAYAVPPGFWAKVVPAVREAFPDAWFLGEMIHGDYAAYAAEAGLDSVTQYEMWKAVWSSLNDRNFYELDHALGRHNAFLDSFDAFGGYGGSSPREEEGRLAARYDGGFCHRVANRPGCGGAPHETAGLPQTFVGNHDVTRLATALNDDRHFGHALAVLFCIGGVPSVYYGDEQGFRGFKEQREGGDDEIRPAFPASPTQLLPDGWRYYRLHQRLIGFRRRHPWLVRARTAPAHLDNSALAVDLRGESAGQRALLLLNTGDAEFRFDVDTGGLSVAETAEPGAVVSDPLLVPAHSWTILA